MSTVNPFDLLGDDDNDDPAHLAEIQKQKLAARKPAAAPAPPAAKLPSKPVPPTQAVREARSSTGPARGAGRGGSVRGRGGRVGNRDFGNGGSNGYAGGYGGEGEGRDGERERERGNWQPSRGGGGGRRGGYGGGYGNEEGGGDNERLRRSDSGSGDYRGDYRAPRREHDRHSGTGRGGGFKREGGGRGNWGTVNDDVIAQEAEEIVNVEEKNEVSDKQPEGDAPTEANKDNKEGAAAEVEEKEEDKEMTLEEYEKIREEKRKALVALKAEERKVEVDKELEAMKLLSVKKGNDDIFIKLGSDKDSGKRKENTEKDERSKKPLSINEFLKPAEGERYFGGRGRGRGRGDRAPFRGGFGGGGGFSNSLPTPSIEDPGQFPTLGGK